MTKATAITDSSASAQSSLLLTELSSSLECLPFGKAAASGRRPISALANWSGLVAANSFPVCFSWAEAGTQPDDYFDWPILSICLVLPAVNSIRWMESLYEDQSRSEGSMARISQTRSRLLRAGMLSASILGFIPVFNLVRQAPAESAGRSVTSSAPSTQAPTPARTPYQAPYRSALPQATPSASQPAAPGTSSQSRAVPSHTRTHAS
jgi:hypothetical protein